MFGAIDDIENYWNVENYSSGIYSYWYTKNKIYHELFSEHLRAEVYFMSSYSSRIGEKLGLEFRSLLEHVVEIFYYY